MTPTCSICGGTAFSTRKVLWPELIAEWELSQAEVAYIDEQQGRCCEACDANLRVVALGDAVLKAFRSALTLRDFVTMPAAAALRVLDINGAQAISPTLARMPRYVRGNYPEIDMQALRHADGSFDLVVHSDTLEHVPDPVLALKECRRVLAPGGKLCFTVPVVVGRLTRSRAGLGKSYHGDPATSSDDFVVRTEFGSDVWQFLAEAGFSTISVNHVNYPAATAWTAWNEPTGYRPLDQS